MPLYKMGTYSGNILFLMNDTLHKEKLSFIQQQGKLMFRVVDIGHQNGYKMKIGITNRLKLPAGKIFGTRLDSSFKELNIDFVYDGKEQKDLQKLRFQITSIRQKDNFSLNAILHHKNSSFRLNPIFKKTVGGILTKNDFSLCEDKECVYTLEMKLKNIKSMNIESFLIGKIETISITHYEEYYDKVYKSEQLTVYELPYIDEMEGLDISINLIPVTGETGLYINAKTLPSRKEEYDWKQTGPYAKKITIQWQELQLMRAEKSNLYIAVYTKNPGEFLLEVDAHDPGFVGKLHSGVIEQGYVVANGFVNYLYYFNVHKTQKINFNVKLNIMSGQADLYLKQCSSYLECKLDSAQINNPGIIKLENLQNPKILENEFTCEYKEGQLASVCQFVIGIKGSQLTDTHYEVSIQESDFSRLMIPGAVANLQMDPNDVFYYKFSYPQQSFDNKLFFQVEALWGQFDVIVSKFEQKPKESNRNLKLSFNPSSLSINESMIITEMNEQTIHDYTTGIYYVAVKAITNASLNMSFFEKSKTNKSQLRTLHMSQQQRGQIENQKEIIYYITKLANKNQINQKIKVNLTPLKGSFIIIANKSNNDFPTLQKHDFISESNMLEIILNPMDYNNDYIIGVVLSPDINNPNDNYQFLISMTESILPSKIYPGIITQQTVSEFNNYYAEITPEMDNIVIMKSVVDGYNFTMCVDFISDNISNFQKINCDFKAEQQQVSLQFTKQQVKKYCNFDSKKDLDCFMIIAVTGNINQKFSIGYTFNNQPFILVKDLVITGPVPVNNNQQLNFIYHGENNKPIGLYFNTKGMDIDIFTKLQQGKQNNQQMKFPDQSDYDQDVQQKRGYITNIQYNHEIMNKYGQQPELLISIKGKSENQLATQLDNNHNFILVTSMEPHEILRTQVYSEFVMEDQWNYYNFYNNGNSENIRVYVSTSASPRLEVLISKGIQSRPPFTNKPLIQKVGFGSIDLEISQKDLIDQKEEMRGYYTIGVRSSITSNIQMYWNNKNDLNFIELTPNEATVFKLEQNRNLYFSFFVKQNEIHKNIQIYFQCNVKIDVFILSSPNELLAPSENDHYWQTSTPQYGGLQVIEIEPKDPHYCTDCLYIVYIKSAEEGQITIQANIKQDNLPIVLLPGITFQDILNQNEQQVYRLYNTNESQIGVSVNMLSGFINLYVSDKSDVSSSNHKEKYQMQKTLDIHKFISIYPQVYNIKSAHDFYLLAQNDREDKAQYTLTVQKNGVNIPIEPGITKYILLAQNETSEYVYQPKPNESLFEIRVELEQVINNQYKKEARIKLNQFIKLYHINQNNERFEIKQKNKSASKNRFYIEFDISKNKNGKFIISVQNPVASPVAITLDLMNGNYKLINNSDYEIDFVRPKQVKNYEAFGQTNKNLFINFNMCAGDLNVNIYYLQNNKKIDIKYERLKNKNTLTYYFKQMQNRFYFDVSSASNSTSLYEVNVFNEKDIEKSEYTKVESGNGGRVFVDLQKNQAQFKPVQIDSNYQEFYHKIKYSIYISDDVNVAQFAKNCGAYMLNAFFNNPHIIKKSFVVQLNKDNMKKYKQNKVKLNLTNLKPGTRYYGQVVARIEIYPQGTQYVSPIKTAKLYYDEFVFITPKIKINADLIISIFVCISIFIALTFIIRNYIFGDINKINEMGKIGEGDDNGNNLFGVDVLGILEKEYYEDEKTEQQQEEELKKQQQNKDAQKDDKTEIEMQEKESREKPLDV